MDREVPVDRHRGRPDEQDGRQEPEERRVAEHDADRVKAWQPRSAGVAAEGERDDGQHEQCRDVDDEHARDAGALDEGAGERHDHDERPGPPGAQAAVSVPVVADRLEGPGVQGRRDAGERNRAQDERRRHSADSVRQRERGCAGRGHERRDRDDERRAGEPIGERAPDRCGDEARCCTEGRHQADQPEVETALLVEDREVRIPGADGAEGRDVAEARGGAWADPHGPRS